MTSLVYLYLKFLCLIISLKFFKFPLKRFTANIKIAEKASCKNVETKGSKNRTSGEEKSGSKDSEIDRITVSSAQQSPAESPVSIKTP